jgi:hypothetical protein
LPDLAYRIWRMQANISHALNRPLCAATPTAAILDGELRRFFKLSNNVASPTVRAHSHGGGETQMKRAIILGVLVLTLHSAAFAEEARTAQDLYGLCIRNEPSCGSYLAGVAAVMAVVGRTYRQRHLDHRAIGPFGFLSICPNGEPMTGVTLSKIFTAWFDNHADRERDPMEHAAIEALLNKWPCERKTT